MVDLISAYGIFPIGALFLVGWLLPTAAAPSGSVGGHLEPLASRMVATLIAMVLLAVGVKVAGMVWADPRPFQIDPSIHPSIAHATDNGFVSDHSALAAALSGLVSAWRRHLGAVMLGLSVVLGLSRVVSGVHHVPDVIGGLAIGLVCAALGLWIGATLWHAVDQRRGGRAANGG